MRAADYAKANGGKTLEMTLTGRTLHEGAREYDPLLGRFTSLDPVFDASDPQSWNGYAYADNNPILKLDPAGTISQCISIDGSGVCGSQLKSQKGKDKLNDYESLQTKTSSNAALVGSPTA